MIVTLTFYIVDKIKGYSIVAQTNIPIKFSLVESGVLPLSPQSYTVYFIPATKQLYVGDRLIADSIDVPEAVENYLADNDVGKLHYDTKANWNSHSTLISQLGHIYVYSDNYQVGDNIYPGIKIGDGNAYLIDLPFIDTRVDEKIDDHINDMIRHITSQERTNWNAKVTTRINAQDEENLIFTYY